MADRPVLSTPRAGAGTSRHEDAQAAIGERSGASRRRGASESGIQSEPEKYSRARTVVDRMPANPPGARSVARARAQARRPAQTQPGTDAEPQARTRSGAHARRALRAQLRQVRSSATPPAWMATGRPMLHRLVRNRRRALIAFGASAATLVGLSSAMAVVFGGEQAVADDPQVSSANQTPRDAGSFSNRDASYVHGVGDQNDLGAGGLADTPSQAAQLALATTPKYPNPLTRDPVLHLLRRSTFGPTPQEVAVVKQIGIDAWIERQLDPNSVGDSVGELVNQLYPKINMSIPELRAAVGNDKRREAQVHLGRATIARQIWSSRQLYEVMVDFWANHLNIQNPFPEGDDNRANWDRDVIRKHAMGKFSDMLLAAARHPAMLLSSTTPSLTRNRSTRTTAASCSNYTPSASTADTTRPTYASARTS
jgi:uncharacterized protein DUF1800